MLQNGIREKKRMLLFRHRTIRQLRYILYILNKS